MQKHVLVLASLCGLAIASQVFGQPKTSPQTPAPSVRVVPGTTNLQVERGRYLTSLGDCVACHTQKGGERFAGARPVETPFGTMLSANITPDTQTGIGQWTSEQFYRALHEGINAHGQHLYPAFPYNYYTQITREDSDAIFAYLQSVPAVHKDFERNKLKFPFNIRAVMIVWNWLFLDRGPFSPDPTKSAQWNRGAYLVQGLGHCEACHTPKNFMGGAERGSAFQGGVFGEWFAPDITANRRTGLGSWTDAELRDFLHDGLNAHSSASTEMGEVVAFSTSQLNDADLDAMVTYLRSVPASPDRERTTPDAAVMRQGEAIFADNCVACHRTDARGTPGYFPPLKGNANVQQSDPTTLLHFILAGTARTPTARKPTPLAMAAFYWKLDDDQIAAVSTYVRNSWGNFAPAVNAEDVAKLRKKLALGTVAQNQTDPVNRSTTLARPGPGTLGIANTDSRDNGTAQAGRVVPRQPATAASR